MAVRRGWSLQLYISAWAKQWAWAILKQFWSCFLCFQSTRKQTVIDSYDQISFSVAFNNLSERLKLRSPTPSRVLFWKSWPAAIKKELDIFAIACYQTSYLTRHCIQCIVWLCWRSTLSAQSQLTKAITFWRTGAKVARLLKYITLNQHRSSYRIPPKFQSLQSMKWKITQATVITFLALQIVIIFTIGIIPNMTITNFIS